MRHIHPMSLEAVVHAYITIAHPKSILLNIKQWLYLRIVSGYQLITELYVCVSVFKAI